MSDDDTLEQRTISRRDLLVGAINTARSITGIGVLTAALASAPGIAIAKPNGLPHLEEGDYPEVSARSRERGITPLYELIAEDLKEGKDLVVATHLGLWTYAHEQRYARRSPEEVRRQIIHGNHSLWASRVGHHQMFDRGRRDPHIRKRFRYHNWEQVLWNEHTPTPIHPKLFTVVYEQTIKPSRFWKQLGVTEPFKVRHVYQVFYHSEHAVIAATKALKGEGVKIDLGDGDVIDTGEARLAGFAGHNPFFDYDPMWDGIERHRDLPFDMKGTYAIGCQTARVGAFPLWLDNEVYGLLFTRHNMWAAGFTVMSMIDNVLCGSSAERLVNDTNNDYQYFQRIGDQERRVGRPFVGEMITHFY